MPTGIATDDTTKYFFQDLMENQSLGSLLSFENEEKKLDAESEKLCDEKGMSQQTIADLLNTHLRTPYK